MSNKIQSWINLASSGRNKRALRGIASMFFNDDINNTMKAITFGANTTNITMSGAYTTGLLVSGAGTTPISITGAFTTGISIAADGTTAIDITSAFSGTTGISFAGTATDGIKISGICGDGIEISSASTGSGINLSGAGATGITIAGQTTMGIALAVAAGVGGIAIDAGTVNHTADGAIFDINVDVEGAYSVNAINVNLDFETTGMGAVDVSAAFKADINELVVHTDGAGLYGTDITMTGFATGRADLVGHLVTLDGSKTAGDTTTGFKVAGDITVNHSGEDLYGLWVDFSSITLTDGNVYGAYIDASFANGSTAYGAYVVGGTACSAVVSINGLGESGIEIAGTFTTAINISAVQTDETGLDAAAVIQHGTYNTALAYGTQTDHLVLKSTHASVACTGVYCMGDVNFIETSGVSTGYIMAGYDYLSIGHDLGWSVARRSRVVITAACDLGEIACVQGSMEVGAFALTQDAASANLSGIYGRLEIAVGATMAHQACAGYFDCSYVKATGLTGEVSGVKVYAGGGTYVDYGFNFECISNNMIAGYHVYTNDSAVLDVGMLFTMDSGSITNAFKLPDDGALASDSATSPLSDIVAQASAGFIRVEIGSATKYIALYDAN